MAYVVTTKMADAPQDGVEVFGPFARKTQAFAWARKNRERMAHLNRDTGDEFRELCDQDGDDLFYGEFVWTIAPMNRPRIG